MAFAPASNNFNDLIRGMTSLKRRAMLTGQPFGSREASNFMDPYFASVRDTTAQDQALGLEQDKLGLAKDTLNAQNEQFGASLAETKRQAQDRLLQDKEAIDQARRTGLLQTGIGGLGTSMMGAHVLGWEPFAAPAAAPAAEIGAETAGVWNAGVAGGGEGGLAAAAPFALPVVGGLVTGKLSTGVKEIGDVATLGSSFGGENERNIAGGAAAGAATGAAIGSVVPGVGTAIGAGVGAVAGGVGGATVICTELHRQGLLDGAVWENDGKYRALVSHETYEGYRILADPIVQLMNRSRLFTFIFAPFAISTAREMAHRVNRDIAGSWLGSLILGVFQPICEWLGQRRGCDIGNSLFDRRVS